MTRAEASRIREQMVAVKIWIEHFQADAAAGLIPSAPCLIAARDHAERALTLLGRLEAEQKDTAA